MDCSYWLYYRLDRLRSPSLKYSRQQYGTLTGPRTRVTHSSITLIDNIYVKTTKYVESRAFVLRSDLSDHFPCLLTVKFKEKNNGFRTIQKRTLNDRVYEQMNHYLLHYDWSKLYTLDVNNAYLYLVWVIQCALNLFASLKEISISN